MDKQIKATASEIANLWASYMNASSTNAMLAYFKENVEDENIRGLLNNAYELSTFALETTSQLLTESTNPVPKGFSEKDINLTAPRLYSDTYTLYFAINLHILVMTHCANGISQSS